MADTPDKRQIYYIPYNYIGESRLHIGQTSLRVRYLADSLILSLGLGVIALAIILLAMQESSVQAKLTVEVFLILFHIDIVHFLRGHTESASTTSPRGFWERTP